MKDISLIGFMGCGKSSVGKILATLLPECRLIDLDTYIETKQCRSIPEIFNEYGEAAFRRMERETLEEIFSDPDRPRAILSLGGGTVTTEECRQLIRQHTDCFYLRATTGTLLANLEGHSEGRPMLSSAQPAGLDKFSDRPENMSDCNTTITESKQILNTSVVKPFNMTDNAAEPVDESAEAPSTEASSKREALRHRIESLMQTRSPQYQSTAHHIIDIDGHTAAQIAAQIAALF